MEPVSISNSEKIEFCEAALFSAEMGNRFIKRVLVVDDEEAVRKIIQRTFNKCWPEVEIFQATDGFQALRMADECEPDLVILDLLLPGQDGFAVADAIRKNPKLQATVILGMSGYNAPENIKRMMLKGASSYLTKPFGPEELKKCFSQYLGNHSCEQRIENSCPVAEGKKGKEPRSDLVHAAAFFSLMMVTFSLRGSAQASSSTLTKNVPIEEPFEKNRAFTIERVAIMPFESSNLYIAGKSFSYILLEHVTKKLKEWTVIERPDIEKVLAEQRLSLTGVIKQGKIRNLGNIEPVDAIVTGMVRTMEYFGEDGGSIVVTVKVVDVRDGKILWAHNQEARCYAVGVDRKALAEELMNRAAKKITKRLKKDLLSGKKFANRQVEAKG